MIIKISFFTIDFSKKILFILPIDKIIKRIRLIENGNNGKYHFFTYLFSYHFYRTIFFFLDYLTGFGIDNNNNNGKKKSFF
jgi:hypothetical protein